VTYPRTLVLAGANSKAAIVESYVSLSSRRYFTNAVTEVVLEDGASV
jgi:Fe-S cluster assembly protein SufD